MNKEGSEGVSGRDLCGKGIPGKGTTGTKAMEWKDAQQLWGTRMPG